ncbi:hypothetical protein EYF80_063207 [Liparis tanakae]|uniref:Uncharacterized protein n=1 Tax=Liparis tanakae TaxID=230148 RepID=A0A4Z2ECM6_9TELE|nr:hypothetical protein EYF80_063207 [Liparis tanakae]
MERGGWREVEVDGERWMEDGERWMERGGGERWRWMERGGWREEDGERWMERGGWREVEERGGGGWREVVERGGGERWRREVEEDRVGEEEQRIALSELVGRHSDPRLLLPIVPQRIQTSIRGRWQSGMKRIPFSLAPSGPYGL